MQVVTVTYICIYKTCTYIHIPLQLVVNYRERKNANNKKAKREYLKKYKNNS